jgi:probable rRNA maturation factor
MSTSPSYDVNIQVQLAGDDDLPTDRLQRAVDWVLNAHDLDPETGLSIVITGDEAVQRLNKQFRGIDAPTGELSFPADPAPVPEAEDRPYLGDLVLSLPYIQRQATAEKHAVADELLLAVIHGTLHLLGYDHDTPERQSAMWAIQSKALQAMGIAITVPLFEFPDSSDDVEPSD